MYTEQQVFEYFASEGSRCPICGSDNTQASPIQADGLVAWSYVTCLNCGEEWKDLYKLEGIQQG